MSGPQLLLSLPPPCPRQVLTSFSCALRACRGCQGPGAWWGDRALKVSPDPMAFLAGMVKQDSR